jgi:5-methylcytosine-specific restriction protein A
MSALSEIMPKKRNRVIDLVSAADVNTDDWKNFKGGPQKAASNPKYCYEWAFVEPEKVVVLSMWHAALDKRDGKIVRDFNIRKSPQEVPGNSVWATRASRMDKAIQQAIKSKLPIRVMLCAGSRRGIDQPKTAASKVAKRELDPVSWTVTSYDWNTGQCTLTRGA